MKITQYQVLARKWRPRQFADVVGQSHVVRALSNALTLNHLHHAYLFTGTRGVGKTTLARILAKCLNCESGITAEPCGQCSSCQEIDQGRFVDLIEVDAASRTKVEDTRDLLDNVQYAPSKGRFKVYLIDEVHMLSGHSFNALLKTLEEPPSHVKFLLATTDPQRLPATVLSRCLQFHLLAMSNEQISQGLQTILTKENIDYETEALSFLAHAAAGSMRDALSLLDQGIAFGNGKVLTADVKNMLGALDKQLLYQILENLAAQNANDLIAGFARLAEQGVDFSRALAELLSLLHQLAIAQAAPETANLVLDEPLKLLAEKISREDVQLYYQIGLLGQRDLPWAPTARSGFEMTLLRMLAFAPDTFMAKQAVSEPAAALSNSQPQPAPLPKKAANATWEELLQHLGLDGATKMLAQHCAIQKLTTTHLQLGLNPKQKLLLSQKHIDRIREAVSKYYGQAMQVDIVLETHTQETPADTAKRQQESQQQAAEQAIFSDPVVQHMIQNFDAKVIKESIHAHTNFNTTNKGEKP